VPPVSPIDAPAEDIPAHVFEALVEGWARILVADYEGRHAPSDEPDAIESRAVSQPKVD
jgi:hypothetical protein